MCRELAIQLATASAWLPWERARELREAHLGEGGHGLGDGGGHRQVQRQPEAPERPAGRERERELGRELNACEST